MMIAGDIGATTTRLALVSEKDGARAFIAQEDYRSADHPGLQPIVEAFLARTGANITSACFGVAGTVLRGHARLTNLPWEIDALQLGEALALDQVDLLNDLEAIGHAVSCLRADELVTINSGEAAEHAPLAILAPGTGLGEGFLI